MGFVFLGFFLGGGGFVRLVGFFLRVLECMSMLSEAEVLWGIFVVGDMKIFKETSR